MSYTSSIFDRLCEHLQTNAEHTARVAFGPACEQWISSEAFVALNWAPSQIRVGTFVLCECRKRDITLFEGDESNPTALATIEAKIVHPNKNLENQLQTLRGQLRHTTLPDETPATERGAIVYAVWSDWWKRRDTRQETDFHEKVRETFKGLFMDEPYTIDPTEKLRPIISCQSISWLGKTYKVSVYGVCAALAGESQQHG
jgi:hypothetical protein